MGTFILAVYNNRRVNTSPTDKCHLCIKVIMAVAHLHATDVIHRDLKPDNIVVHLDHNGIPQPLVADFGLAQFYIKERERISVDTAFAVYYRAPEHLAGEEKKGAAGQIYRPSSDVWALGMCLYYIMRGKHLIDEVLGMPPGYSPTPADALRTIYQSECAQKLETLPPPIREVVMMMLKTDVTRRATLKDVLAHSAVIPFILPSPSLSPPSAVIHIPPIVHTHISASERESITTFLASNPSPYVSPTLLSLDKWNVGLRIIATSAIYCHPNESLEHIFHAIHLFDRTSAIGGGDVCLHALTCLWIAQKIHMPGNYALPLIGVKTGAGITLYQTAVIKLELKILAYLQGDFCSSPVYLFGQCRDLNDCIHILKHVCPIQERYRHHRHTGREEAKVTISDVKSKYTKICDLPRTSDSTLF